MLNIIKLLNKMLRFIALVWFGLILLNVNAGLKAPRNPQSTAPRPPHLPRDFNISVITWNLNERAVTSDSCTFLRNYRSSDMVVIGVQELEDIRPRNQPGHRTRALVSQISRSLGPSLPCIARHQLGGMQLSVHCKKRLFNRIAGIQVVDVACGTANLLPHKGAVAVLLRMKGMKGMKRCTLALINAHLAAHQAKVSKRNEDFHRISSHVLQSSRPGWLLRSARSSERVVRSQQPPLPLSPQLTGEGEELTTHSHSSYSSSSSSMMHGETLYVDLSDSRDVGTAFDAVVWMGDLNYRLSGTRQMVMTAMKRIDKTARIMCSPPDYSRLLSSDQLTAERTAGRVFSGLSEGPITFPPTYKFDIGRDSYDSSAKCRVPAWTDRVLYANNGPTKLVNTLSSRHSSNPLRSDHGIKSTTNTQSSSRHGMLKLIRYASERTVRHSDHRPVTATFLLRL